jgi:hypothetical protein
MPTPTELQSAYSGATLTALERELVRRIIGISGVSGDPVRDDSETRMMTLDAPRNVAIREALDAAGDVGFDRMKIAGGSRGAYINPDDNLYAVKRELLRIIYGDIEGVGVDPRIPAGTSADDGSGIRFVRLGYSHGSQNFE